MGGLQKVPSAMQKESVEKKEQNKRESEWWRTRWERAKNTSRRGYRALRSHSSPPTSSSIHRVVRAYIRRAYLSDNAYRLIERVVLRRGRPGRCPARLSRDPW